MYYNLNVKLLFLMCIRISVCYQHVLGVSIFRARKIQFSLLYYIIFEFSIVLKYSQSSAIRVGNFAYYTFSSKLSRAIYINKQVPLVYMCRCIWHWYAYLQTYSVIGRNCDSCWSCMLTRICPFHCYYVRTTTPRNCRIKV